MSFLYASFLWILIPLGGYLRNHQGRYSLQEHLRWITLTLLIVSIARPVLIETPQEEKIPAHAITIALDLSASMRVEDIQPSRLQASKQSIRLFLEQNRYDQIALIGFTINPLLLSPSTTDHKLIAVALETIKSEYILTKGTDLPKLLKRVADFSEQEKKLILFSDGGDEPISEELITFAQEHQIRILAVAMATQAGASISDRDGEILKDKAGNIVVSKFNRGLSSLAEVIPFESASKTAKAIESWVQSQKQLEEKLTHQTHAYFELFFIPTFLALVLLFLSATRFSLKLLAILALLGVNLEAGMLPDGYYLHQAYGLYDGKEYNASLESLQEIEISTFESQRLKAHLYYKTEQYKQAKRVLTALKSSNPQIKQQLLYELGNCEAKLAYFDKAEHLYVQALQLGEDNDTLHNLAWVIGQKRIDHAKVGFTNPQGATTPQGQTDKTIESDKKSDAKSESQESSSGGGGDQSKSSSVKVVKSTEAGRSKRVMSSKAYDLINEGYIREEKPW